jgi:hypothetical protein
LTLLRLTALYLACKVEEHYHEVGDLLIHLKYSPTLEETILEKEILLLSSLKFQLKVYHPIRPLYSFILQLKVHKFITQKWTHFLGSTPYRRKYRRESLENQPGKDEGVLYM